MNNQNSNSGSNILLGVGIGIIIGGVAGYYLASDEGQELREKAADKLAGLDKQVRSTLKEQNEAMASKMNNAVESSSSWIENAKTTVQEKLASVTNKAEDAVEDVEDSYQSGVNKAKAKIEEHKRTLNGVIENA